MDWYAGDKSTARDVHVKMTTTERGSACKRYFILSSIKYQ